MLLEIPDLRKFVAKVDQLKQIHQLISTKLEPSLADHCQVANLRDGTLILATTSPAWNHKLRFSAMDLLSALRADPRWSGLKAIEVRVDYLPQLENTSATKSKKRVSLSTNNAEYLRQAADNISCEKLSNALKKLAKNSER